MCHQNNSTILSCRTSSLTLPMSLALIWTLLQPGLVCSLQSISYLGTRQATHHTRLLVRLPTPLITKSLSFTNSPLLEDVAICTPHGPSILPERGRIDEPYKLGKVNFLQGLGFVGYRSLWRQCTCPFLCFPPTVTQLSPCLLWRSPHSQLWRAHQLFKGSSIQFLEFFQL